MRSTNEWTGRRTPALLMVLVLDDPVGVRRGLRVDGIAITGADSVRIVP